MKHFLRYIILAVVVLSASDAAWSATSGDELLNKIVGYLKAKNTLEIDYEMSTGGDTFAGTMTISGKRIAVKSGVMDSWYDGTTQWTYNPRTNEVSVTEPTDEEVQQLNPFAIVNAFRSAYNVAMAPKREKSKFDVVYLTPKDPGADISKVEMAVPTGASYPARITMRMKSGDVLIITIRRIIRGVRPTADTFRYSNSLHPGATVVDLR